MRTRSPFLLLLALLALVAASCASDGELGGPTLGGTPAAVIGDHVVSNADLAEEVEAWASNPAMLDVIGMSDLGTEGARSSQLATFALSHRIVSEQARLLLREARAQASAGTIDLAAQGVDGEALAEPTDEEVDAILEQLDTQFTSPEGLPVFRGFEEDFRRRLARDLAYQDRLQILLPLGIEPPEVSVNPRYGEVVVQDGIVQVTPLSGPLPSLET